MHYYWCLPIDVHNLIAIPLGFLVVFRSSLAYDRYWQGRTAISGVIGDVKEFIRKVIAFLDGNESEIVALRRELIRLILAQAGLIVLHVQQEFNEAALHKKKINLTRKEIERLTHEENRPEFFAMYITCKLAEIAKRGYLSDKRLAMLETVVTDMVDYYSEADKIKSTPFPMPYAQLCKVFIIAFCLTVPFPIATIFDWFAAAPTALIAFGFFGIDEVAIQLEDPFGDDDNDLPLHEWYRALIKESNSMIAEIDPSFSLHDSYDAEREKRDLYMSLN